MALFDIDDPEIDIAELEARVRAAIEAKRGVRFADEELEELRAAELRPRLRNEDLPRSFIADLHRARSKLPEVTPPPAGDLGFEPALELHTTGFHLRGFVRVCARLVKVMYDVTANLDPVLNRMAGQLGERITEQGAWAGRQLSDMTAQLDRWRDRDLNLMHNLVAEVTRMRVQQLYMQDRISELIRELEALRHRERVLESLATPAAGEDQVGGEQAAESSPRGDSPGLP